VALIEFFRRESSKKPRVVATSGRRRQDHVGYVTNNFGEGTIILTNEEGEYFRLEWAPTGCSSTRSGTRIRADARRPLSAGRYTVVNYRVVRRDRSGHEWFTSTTGLDIAKVDVVEGKTTAIVLNAGIEIGCEAIDTGDSIVVSVAVQGHNSAGLAIYCDGKRIPLTFSVVGADGNRITGGPMQYG